MGLDEITGLAVVVKTLVYWLTLEYPRFSQSGLVD
ncbi:MAG: hypothetical protein RLZZ568_1244 [Cyanobacteriota bacterium]|jgi:hypothetical protein